LPYRGEGTLGLKRTKGILVIFLKDHNDVRTGPGDGSDESASVDEVRIRWIGVKRG
jgi:hypothetical protein